jgi:glycosyltransferase involved in cell wall biosynthesis
MIKYLCFLGWFFSCAFLSLLFFTKPIGKFFGKRIEKELNIAHEVKGDVVEKHLVVVVPSYNNERYASKNIASICSQNYTNFEVIYVDDASTDHTYQVVLEQIAQFGMEEKFKVIRNSKNKGAMYNHYTMAHMCKDEDIVVVLDGDDWFANEDVLSKVNRYYANPDVWMTYGQYLSYPDYARGCSAPVSQEYLKNGDIRKDPWRYSHLRTFYAGLFKQIKLEDFLYQGEFFKVSCDVAIMFPLIEMAREHCYFIPDILYIYNYQSPINDAKVREPFQKQMEMVIRDLPKYVKLESPFPGKEESTCDVIVFSYNRPLQLYAFLESFYKHVKGYRTISVIYRSDEEYVDGYAIVKKDFPAVHFFSQENPPHDFKRLTLEALSLDANHVVFAVDDVLVKEDIDLKKDMEEMDWKGAYGFFYRLGDHVDYCYMLDRPQKVPSLIEFSEDLYGWVFEKGDADWAYPNALDFVLYRKKEIQSAFLSLDYTNPNKLEGNWSRLANVKQIGLCHKNSKILNIPVNIVSTFQNRSMNSYSAEELNLIFLDGLKFDTAPFEGMLNKSPHIEADLTFIPRES